MINWPWAIASFKWIPNDGPLVVTLENSLGNAITIGSLYLPNVDVEIEFAASPTPPNGNPFYVASPPSEETNPQTIPMPAGTMQVTLTASSATAHYVFAASGIYRPLMEGASAQ